MNRLFLVYAWLHKSAVDASQAFAIPDDKAKLL